MYVCISNTSDSVSLGYPNTEKRVKNTTRSGVFLTKFEIINHSLSNFITKAKENNIAFFLSWPTAVQIIGTKENVYLRKEFNSHRIGLETNMASVWDTNMAPVTSNKNTLSLANKQGTYVNPFVFSYKERQSLTRNINS